MQHEGLEPILLPDWAHNLIITDRTGSTVNLTESIYFTKINRKRANHTHLSNLIKIKTFNMRARALFYI